jgi:adenylate cyclase
MEEEDSIKKQIAANESVIKELNTKLNRRTNEINIIQSISDEIITSLDLEQIFQRSMELLDQLFGFKHSMIFLCREDDSLEVVASRGYETDGLGAKIPIGKGIVGVVAKNKKILRMSGIGSRMRYIKSVNPSINKVKLPGLENVESQIALPLLVHGKLIGVYSVESTGHHAFKAIDEMILDLVAKQIATAIDNASAYDMQKKLTEMYSRFVPMELMQTIGYKNILEAKLSDQKEQEMTVMFVDIRNFTGMSEKMTPEENFRFLNDYLHFIAPTIEQNNGFIDKYMGDAIMAIFPQDPLDAIKASLQMEAKLSEFNHSISAYQVEEVSFGIGIHTGRLIAGIIGFKNRLEGTVIGDSVNTASRIEGLTKKYPHRILISENAIDLCCKEMPYEFIFVDEVQVKGRVEKIKVYSIDYP